MTTRTHDNSYPGQLAPKTSRTQDNSHPRQLVSMWYDMIWYYMIKKPYDIISYHISRYDIITHLWYIISYPCSMIWNDAIWYDMIYDMIYDMVWCDIWYDTISYHNAISYIISYHIIPYINVIVMLISQPSNIYTSNWVAFRSRTRRQPPHGSWYNYNIWCHKWQQSRRRVILAILGLQW